MKLSTTFFQVFSFLSILLFSSVTLAENKSPAQITIGTLYASNGPFATISMPVYNGLKLWINDVNANGGVYVKPYNKKIPIKLISYDDQSSTSTAATLYNRLITQDHVDILVADSGSVLTSVAVPIAKTHKMLLIDQTGTSAKFFTADNRYIVHTSDPVSTNTVEPVAQFINDVAVNHGVHRIAVLYTTNDFSGPQSQALRDFLAKGSNHDKLQIVYFNGVPNNTTNYTVLLHTIAATKPDAVVELGYPDNDMAFLRDLRSSGLRFRMVWVTYPGLELPTFRKNLTPDAMDGIFTSVTPLKLTYKPDIGLNAQEFSAAYQRTYNSDASFNSAAGYNTGLVLEKALSKTTSMDQPALRDALFALSGKLTTLMGHFRLNSDGAQLGLALVVGQMKSDGKDGVTVDAVYPPEVAKMEPVWGAAQ